MRFIVIILLAFPLLSIAQGTESVRDIKGLKILQQITYIDTTGKSFDFDSTVTEVYSSGNIILHNLVYQYEGSIQNIELVSEIRHHYFIYSKDSLYGYDWDGHREPVVKRLKIDSVLGKDWKIGSATPYEQIFAGNNAELLSSHTNTDSNTVHEIYRLKAKSDLSSQSTCFLDYIKRSDNGMLNSLIVPGNLKDMNISKIRVITEGYPCKFDLKYTIENIPLVNKNIGLIFDEYLNNRSEKYTTWK